MAVAVSSGSVGEPAPSAWRPDGFSPVWREGGMFARVILAGIDEAGYGPILGPLVVGCAAVSLPDDPDGLPIPDVWSRLRRAVSRQRDGSGKRLHVNDSKKVYSPSVGLAELERSVLCLAAACHGDVVNLDALLRTCAAESCDDLAEAAWYRGGSDEVFPLEQDRLALQLVGNKLRHELARAGVDVCCMQAHVVPEGRLNRMFDATRNKSATSFSFVVRHIDQLMTRFADGRLVIVCDRQGGREHYGSLLRQMFEGWSLEIVQESPPRSEYRLSQSARSATLIFAEKAEEQCISVALASMLSKYLREALMHRFNRYWQGHCPALKPTAGYWTDGLRFLKDLEPKLGELGMDASTLARRR